MYHDKDFPRPYFLTNQKGGVSKDMEDVRSEGHGRGDCPSDLPSLYCPPRPGGDGGVLSPGDGPQMVNVCLGSGLGD